MKPPKDDSAPNAVVARRIELTNPKRNLRALQECQIGDVTLKDGKRVRKRAVAFEVKDSHTALHHHITVRLETKRLQKNGGSWVLDEETAFALDDEAQIDALVTFLSGLKEARERNIRGNVLVAPLGANADPDAVRQTLKVLATSERASLLVELLNAVSGDEKTLRALTETARSHPDQIRSAVAAINIGRFEAVLRELESAIEEDAREDIFQKLLAANPWLFGSEYSELHPRRIFTRDQQQDFMLRRTADGYLEVIEIKTPLRGVPLFLYDKDHDSWMPRRELSSALGQVMNYLEKLDAARHTIQAEDGEDVTKVRARIIIGKDGDLDQTRALRRLNGHLHRVEVLTFDMLARIGHRVVRALQAPDAAKPQGEPAAPTSVTQGDEDIPF